MRFTHLVMFKFFAGAGGSAPPAPADRVVNAPFLVNIGAMLNR
jgi:hypothetical protein